MAVVSRIAKLRIQSAADPGIFRQWAAIATVQDTAAGGSVSISVSESTGGATPPDAATTLLLTFYNDIGAAFRDVVLDPAVANQTVTFHFTNTGAAGGAARCGTVEIAIYAKREVAEQIIYEVETDGNPNTPGTGNESVLDRGWIRGTTTLTEAVSNVALGGTKDSPAAYDESLFVRTTSGTASYVARALTVGLSAGALTGATNSTTSAIRDVTFSNVCDDRFPAAATVTGISVTVPNATLTGVPDWTYTATTDDSITVDPRLTVAHHFQVDDDIFGLAKNDTTKQMLSTSSGFLWTRLANARGVGVNGITLTQILDPQSPGTTISGASTTSAQAGQDGWSGRLDWTSSKPGGAWDKSVDVTAPVDIDSDTHLINGTDQLTMLAPDPRISVLVSFGLVASSIEGDHVHPGDDMKLAVTVFNRDTNKRIAPDTSSVSVRLIRWNAAQSRFEYLDSDGTTWVAWTTQAAISFDLTTEADGITFTRIFSATAGWAVSDIVAIHVVCKVGGTPYGFYVSRELVEAKNRHDRYAVDPLALALSGLISQK